MTLPPILSGPLSVPLVASPMFIASGPELVSAQCQAGVVGSFPALNARPQSMLVDWLQQITESNADYAARHPEEYVAPFAVNQIVHRSNERLEQDLEVIVEHRVPIVITSLGAREEVNEAVHSYGGIVLHDVISNEFAHKAIDKGADGIVAVAAGAGGHAGTQSPFALLQEIRRWFDGPLLLSGSIAHGRSILAAQAAGADLAYAGTAFLATEEARSADDYKNMIVDSTAKDIVYSNLFTGVHGNYLRGSIVAAGLDPDDLPESDPSAMNFGSGGNTDAKAWRDIWGAGQGLGAIESVVPARELVQRLRDEYEQAWTSLERRRVAMIDAG
ncbi:MULTISPECIES: NAD(P)H-dependent flavin oxidoreductase [Rhodococcus]|uniref:NAD(P)H-dependent flavin oxidoreductase n=1 Tax=Rhodococcus TaxID=1827 RepID=UPI000D04B255|nr:MULTISPECIES: nitronate monooxygenase family protein [Rhodococcus]AYA26414.1 nitronate monooxygenase [Rhodococcus rhodochrous]MCD2099368.1 nitronate monooxygenase family protein [Rhodococcus rhodochrous]MCD2123737.1 nitronate monooxygenase family protein [Rhodococcus rhodochrous]MCQ4136344.1 nitronate monooxygenase family protein [Rhodococcus rhodochrous]MDC3726551.1 nitronate monooxygenase [Rhodococcus sp. Rp3]